MKTFVALLLCSGVLVAEAEDQVQIVRHGTNVTERPSAVFITNIIELVRSCLYPNYIPVKAETWKEFERSDSFVLVTFAATNSVKVRIVDRYWEQPKFKIRESHETIIDQILVPLPESGPGPANIFVKSSTNVLSFSKWDPKILGIVGCEPALQMSSQFYKSLAAIRPDK